MTYFFLVTVLMTAWLTQSLQSQVLLTRSQCSMQDAQKDSDCDVYDWDAFLPSEWYGNYTCDDDDIEVRFVINITESSSNIGLQGDMSIDQEKLSMSGSFASFFKMFALQSDSLIRNKIAGRSTNRVEIRGKVQSSVFIEGAVVILDTSGQITCPMEMRRRAVFSEMNWCNGHSSCYRYGPRKMEYNCCCDEATETPPVPVIATSQPPCQSSVYNCSMNFNCGSDGARMCVDGYTGSSCDIVAPGGVADCDAFDSDVFIPSKWTGNYTCASENDRMKFLLTVTTSSQIALDGVMYIENGVVTTDGSFASAFNILTLQSNDLIRQDIFKRNFTNVELNGRLRNSTFIDGVIIFFEDTGKITCPMELRREKILQQINWCNGHGECHRYGSRRDQYRCCCDPGFVGDTCLTEASSSSPVSSATRTASASSTSTATASTASASSAISSSNATTSSYSASTTTATTATSTASTSLAFSSSNATTSSYSASTTTATTANSTASASLAFSSSNATTSSYSASTTTDTTANSTASASLAFSSSNATTSSYSASTTTDTTANSSASASLAFSSSNATTSSYSDSTATYTIANSTASASLAFSSSYATTTGKNLILTTTSEGKPLENAIGPGCTSYGWNISVDMSILKQLYPTISTNHIYFGDTSCRGRMNGTALIFQQGFRDCLTAERVSRDTFIYENILFYAVYDPIHPFIIRQHNWTFSVECDVSRAEATAFHVHHVVNSHHAAVMGHYNISSTFFKDANFIDQIAGNPVYAGIGENIYVKVFTTTDDWTIKMRLNTCYTKPNDVADDKLTYYIIKDGCEADSTTHIISQTTHETRFVFQNFEYSSDREGLNVFCNATFCETSDQSAACTQSCQ